MRQIKASEIQPGMTIRWDQADMRIELPVKSAERGVVAVCLRSPQGKFLMVSLDAMVTVLDEAQPEEPKAGGARVVVGGRRFLRADDDSLPWVEPDVWDWYTWDYLCSLGHVTVIPDQGWTVPDTPEVPERIDEWPEDDAALRPYPWRDVDGCIWRHGGNSFGDGWTCGRLLHSKPFRGPWTRVPSA